MADIICNQCKIPKSEDNFYTQKRRGIRTPILPCKECRRNNYRANPEKYILSNKKYRQKPDVKEKRNKYFQKWRDKNKEKYNEYQRNYMRKFRLVKKNKNGTTPESN